MAEGVTKEEVKWFLEDLMNSPPEARAQVISQLRREQSSTVDDKTFFCERLGCGLVTPCHLRACDFNCKNLAIRNCLLSVRGTERNEIMDIAKALGVDEAEAKHEVAEAFTQLREASLAEAVDSSNVNRYDMISGTGVCVVCGGVTPEPYQETDGFVYCRKECYREKPPNLLAVERKYRADVRHVLRIALETFKQIPLISSALRIPRSSLLRHYEFYLGVKPTSFGLDVVDIVDLLRRKKGIVLDDFIVIPKSDLARYPKWQRYEDTAIDLVRNL